MNRRLHIALNLHSRRCLVVGGGPVAARRARRLLEAGARVRVVSPRFHPRLLRLHHGGRLELLPGRFRPRHLRGCSLAVAATDDPRVNHRVWAAAHRHGVLVNRADGFAADFSFPATLHQDPISIGISTGGASPLLARRLKEDLSTRWAPGAARWARVLQQLRPWLHRQPLSPRERRRLWQKLVHPGLLDILSALPRRRRQEAAASYLATGRFPLLETGANGPQTGGDDS